MSDLEKLFEAIGNRSVTICPDSLTTARRTWHVHVRLDDYDIHAEGDTPTNAVLAALPMVLDHAQAREREGEAFARKARDEVARLRIAFGASV